jgi:hypothetical protein
MYRRIHTLVALALSALLFGPWIGQAAAFAQLIKQHFADPVVGWDLPPGIAVLEPPQGAGRDLVLKGKGYARWHEFSTAQGFEPLSAQDFTLNFRYRHAAAKAGAGITGDVIIRGSYPQYNRGYHVQIDTTHVTFLRESPKQTGSQKVSLASAAYTFKPGQWYTVTIVANGHWFFVKVDNQQVLKAYDPQKPKDPPPLPAGIIALGCLDGTEFHYDNVELAVYDGEKPLQISLTAEPAAGSQTKLTAKATLNDVPLVGATVDWGAPGGNFASSGTNRVNSAKTDEAGCCTEFWSDPAGKGNILRMSLSAGRYTGGGNVFVMGTDSNKTMTLKVEPSALWAGQTTTLTVTASQKSQAPTGAGVDWMADIGQVADSGKGTTTGAKLEKTGAWPLPSSSKATSCGLHARVMQGTAFWGEANVTLRAPKEQKEQKANRPITGCSLTATPPIVQVGEKTEVVFKAPPQGLPKNGANVFVEADGGSFSLKKSDPLSASPHPSAQGQTDTSGSFTLYWGFPAGGVSKGSYNIRASMSYRSPDGQVFEGHQSVTVIVTGPVKVDGTIHMVMAVGGETTGVVIQTKDAVSFELAFGKHTDLQAKAGELAKIKKMAEVTGTLDSKKGVEVKQRLIITVATLKEVR